MRSQNYVPHPVYTNIAPPRNMAHRLRRVPPPRPLPQHNEHHKPNHPGYSPPRPSLTQATSSTQILLRTTEYLDQCKENYLAEIERGNKLVKVGPREGGTEIGCCCRAEGVGHAQEC
jgi:hypothetical protein